MIIEQQPQWTRQKTGNWLIDLLFGCQQQRTADMAHIQDLEKIIHDLKKSANSLKVELETLKIDHKKLKETNFVINTDIAQKEILLEELMKIIEDKKIDLSQNQLFPKQKRRVRF